MLENCQKIEIAELCKGVHCVDLGESFQTHIYLQTLASIQPRTSPVKFPARHAVLGTQSLSSAPFRGAGPEAAPVSAPKVVRQPAEEAAARPAVAKKSAGKKKQAAVRPAVAKKSAGKKKLRPWYTEDGMLCTVERPGRRASEPSVGATFESLRFP